MSLGVFLLADGRFRRGVTRTRPGSRPPWPTAACSTVESTARSLVGGICTTGLDRRRAGAATAAVWSVRRAERRLVLRGRRRGGGTYPARRCGSRRRRLGRQLVRAACGPGRRPYSPRCASTDSVDPHHPCAGCRRPLAASSTAHEWRTSRVHHTASTAAHGGGAPARPRPVRCAAGAAGRPSVADGEAVAPRPSALADGPLAEPPPRRLLARGCAAAGSTRSCGSYRMFTT